MLIFQHTRHVVTAGPIPIIIIGPMERSARVSCWPRLCQNPTKFVVWQSKIPIFYQSNNRGISLPNLQMVSFLIPTAPRRHPDRLPIFYRSMGWCCKTSIPSIIYYTHDVLPLLGSIHQQQKELLVNAIKKDSSGVVRQIKSNSNNMVGHMSQPYPFALPSGDRPPVA